MPLVAGQCLAYNRSHISVDDLLEVMMLWEILVQDVKELLPNFSFHIFSLYFFWVMCAPGITALQQTTVFESRLVCVFCIKEKSFVT